jgi:hypothetical protein
MSFARSLTCRAVKYTPGDSRIRRRGAIADPDSAAAAADHDADEKNSSLECRRDGQRLVLSKLRQVDRPELATIHWSKGGVGV